MHTGDADERALFERLEREFADVRVPSARANRLPPRRRSTDRVRRWLATVTTVVVCLGALAVVLQVEYGIRITASGLEGPARLRPEVVSNTTGAFAYAAMEGGDPVTYSPCGSIPLVVNSEQMPSGAGGLVEDAVGRVASLTGLDVYVEGGTNEQASPGRRAPRHDRYGNRWAPVLLAWSNPSQEPALVGDVAGVGGSTTSATTASGRPRYVTGAIALDSPTLARMLGLPHGRALVRAVIMHELGHVVGLAHVDDPSELMNRDNIGVTDFGPGDREGLANIGAGPCL